MLLRYSSLFAQHCEFKELQLPDLLRLLDALRVEHPRLHISHIEVKFIASANLNTIHNIKLEKFEELWREEKAIIRAYIVHFSEQDLGRCAPADFVHFYVSQVLKEKNGTPKGALCLGAVGCFEQTFAQFVETVRSTLGVTLSPPPGSSWDRERLSARWLRRHVDRELVAHVSGAIDAKQFDTAIKAAIGIVESRLRQRCIDVGCLTASAQAGADLAIAAFHKDKGCLTPPWPIATEALHGTQLMFQGFFMYLRNAYMHNSVVMGADESAVYDTLTTCEFLLKVIDKSTKR